MSRSLVFLAVLAIVSVISSVLSVAANGSTFNISLTPSCGPPGTLVTFTYPGSPTDADEQPSEFTSIVTCPVNQPCFFTVLNVPAGHYTLYWYMQDGSIGIGNFFVGDCPAVGGVVLPINRSVVIAPYLALFGMVAVVAVVVAAPWKKKTDTVSR